MSELTVSIFTPTHNPKYLLEAYESIKDQSYNEWVVYPNGGATVDDIPKEIIADNRTVIINPGAEFTPKLAEDGLPNIGSVKKYVCGKCKGDILVEFDHDDLMVPPAIDRVREAFSDPGVVFAYSNTADFNNEDRSPRFYGNANAETNYDSINDWVYRDFYYKDVLYKEAVCPEPTPYHASLIWFAPNHFRAFRKLAYDRIGGHNEDLATLDDQDLMCRLYLEGKFYHIKDIPVGLNFINRLKPREFDWNMRDGGKVDIHEMGFVSQELQKAQEEEGVTVPGLVYDSNPEKLEAAYGYLVPVLVQSVKDLSAKLEAALERIAMLEA